jgi:hypothetical protein
MQCSILLSLTTILPVLIGLLTVPNFIGTTQATHHTPSPHPRGVCAGVSGRGSTSLLPVSGGDLDSLRTQTLLSFLLTITILLLQSSISLDKVLLILTTSNTTPTQLYVNLTYCIPQHH